MNKVIRNVGEILGWGITEVSGLILLCHKFD